MTSLDRVTLASRVLTLAAVAGLVLAADDDQALVSLILVSIVGLVAIYLSLSTLLSPTAIVAVEAGLIGLVIGLALPSGAVFLPYLVVLALIGGISQGVRGVGAVLAAQISTVGLLAFTAIAAANRIVLWEMMAPWLITGTIAGLVGTWLRQTGRVHSGAPSDPSYESARRLLSQLRVVSRNLSSGLDLKTMGDEILRTTSDYADVTHAGVFVRTEGGLLSPLAYTRGEARDRLQLERACVAECQNQMEPVLQTVGSSGSDSVTAALPLRVGSRTVGIVVAELEARPARDHVERLMSALDDMSLRLDTALTFEEVRGIATSEERRRIAREIHDGVAQEVASLGYLVDGLRATTDSTTQDDGLRELRSELSRVVNELRLSIFDLRTEVVAETGLGAALSDYVRKIGSKTSMTVHLTLDEGPTRLRPEAEAELLRIAGEAITNARKHSGALNLWVNCTVHSPYARIEVRDDGRGDVSERTDSYGLRIMRERAERLGANFEIVSLPCESRSGTTIRVTVGEPPQVVSVRRRDELDDAGAQCHSPSR